MNAARLERSARLQRVLRLLQDGYWHSTLSIIGNANVCAVNSCIAELRANGQHIECKRRGDTWVYRLAPVGQLSLLAAA
jgi:hypothetical protein